MVDDDLSAVPSDLKPEGAALWHWLLTQFGDIESARPLAHELCRVADRLSEMRAKIATQGLMVSGVRGRSTRHPLVDAEIKLSGQYVKLWARLGLSDKPDDDDEAPRRPVGRPSESDKLWPV